MNEKKEYITITELAELLGVSRQSIYQRSNTSLKPYLKVIKGIKCIEKSAINDVYGKEFLQDVE
jgi:HTH domain.